jgi:hypothetical protein
VRKQTSGDVVREVTDYLDLSIASVEVARLGLRMFREGLLQHPPADSNPDPMVYIGAGDPNDPSTVPTTAVRRSALLSDTAQRARVDVELGQQWIVATYSRWEGHFRPELARSLVMRSEDVVIPLFGDLRRLRHDVVHHLGTATAEWSGRCELLPALAENVRIEVGDAEFRLIRQAWAATASELST